VVHLHRFAVQLHPSFFLLLLIDGLSEIIEIMMHFSANFP